jgi:hypothetical protein
MKEPIMETIHSLPLKSSQGNPKYKLAFTTG